MNVCVTFENPNAGLLDALAALGTGGGLAYSLGIYPSMMQDEVCMCMCNCVPDVFLAYDLP